jgi:hypothetical protein
LAASDIDSSPVFKGLAKHYHQAPDHSARPAWHNGRATHAQAAGTWKPDTPAFPSVSRLFMDALGKASHKKAPPKRGF